MIRVASVPAGHPYVQNNAAPGVVVLPDPPVQGAPAGQWWPPVVLDARWVRAHAAEFDVMHVHFGTEGRSVAELEAFVGALREVERPLVFTAHDLDHPHLTDQSHYRAQLDVLARAADAVLTLTDHAAAELRTRFGVQAQVVAHPQLAPDAWFGRADLERLGRASTPPTVAIHLRELRANVRPGPWLAALAAATHRSAGSPLQIYVNDGPAPARATTDLLDGLLATIADTATVEVHRRLRPDDDELAGELAAADVSVLPYAHGTHSGWLELCWDLGTRVLAPQVGAMAAQHHDPWFLRSFDQARPAGLAAELEALLAAPAPPPAAERLAERRAVAAESQATHRELYERLAVGHVAG